MQGQRDIQSLNLCLFIGNLGQDPELKYSNNGSAYLRFSIACSKRFKQNNEWKSKTRWIPCIAWGAKAETIAKYFKKGSRIHITGEYDVDEYVDKQSGQKRKSYSVEVKDLISLDPIPVEQLQKYAGQHSNQPANQNPNQQSIQYNQPYTPPNEANPPSYNPNDYPGF